MILRGLYYIKTASLQLRTPVKLFQDSAGSSPSIMLQLSLGPTFRDEDDREFETTPPPSPSLTRPAFSSLHPSVAGAVGPVASWLWCILTSVLRYAWTSVSPGIAPTPAPTPAPTVAEGTLNSARFWCSKPFYGSRMYVGSNRFVSVVVCGRVVHSGGTNNRIAPASIFDFGKSGASSVLAL